MAELPPPAASCLSGSTAPPHHTPAQSPADNEELFRQVTRAITQVFWMTTVDKSRMIYISPGYERIWGRSCQSLYDSPESWLDAIHPDDRQRILDAAHTRQADGSYDFEYRILRPDGAQRWIRDRAFPIHDSAGNVYRIAGIAEDITPRKEHERERDTLIRLIEHSHDFISTADLTGRLIYLNPGGRRMIGLPDDYDVRTVHFSDYVPPDWHDYFLNHVIPTVRREGLWLGEMQLFNRQTGQRVDVVRSSFCIRDPFTSQPLFCFATVTRDITQQKREREQLRASEEQLRLANHAGNIGTYVAELEADRVVGSPELLEMAGLPPGTTTTIEGTYQLIHRDDRDRTRAMFDRLLDPACTDIAQAEIRILRPDGQVRWLTISGQVTFRESPNGRVPTRQVGACTDITERKRQEQQMQLYQQNLRSLANQILLIEERERRRLAVDLHDGLGQTLAAARMKLSALRERAAAAGLADPLRDVSSLLEQALHETSTLSFELSPPVLHELGFLPAARWLAEDIERRYGLRVLVDHPPDFPRLPARIAIVLFRCLRELLINAAKHAQASLARVALNPMEDAFRLSVQDDGRGFDPLVTQREVAGDPGKGGFGLFSIRERLEHLGGRLDISSAPAHDAESGGSTVTLIVPLKAFTEDQEKLP